MKTTKDRAPAAHDQPDAVRGAIDDPGVDSAPEQGRRHPLHGLDDRLVIDLVDEVLAEQELVQPGEAGGDAVGRAGPLEIERRRQPDASERDPCRQRHQGQFRRNGPALLLRRGRGRLGRAGHIVRRAEAGLEEGFDSIASVHERVRHADVSGQHRSDGQNDQRDGHRGRGIVEVAMIMVRVARGVRVGPPLAEECEVQQTEHVGGREKRRHERDRPERAMSGGERPPQDLILGEEAGQERHAGNRQRTDEKRPERDRQRVPQPAHLAQVLLTVERMDDRARPEEQQGLEEGVCVQVEDAAAKRPDAHGQEHVPELRDRRVCQHALDVVLHQADRARHERGQHPDDGDDFQRLRCVAEQDRVAADHVHAGGHHRGRVDEGRHRRRAFHGVGQPDVERNLGRLAGRAEEEQQRDAGQRAEAQFRRQRAGFDCHLLEIERAEELEQPEHPEHEAEVADAVDDKRLLAGVGRGRLREPEADQQIRTQPDTFPADEHHREARAEHQHEHERRKQVQIREVARELGVVLRVHVRRRVQVDQRPDAGDHQNHQGRERIEVERERNIEPPGREPGIDDLIQRAHAADRLGREQRADGRHGHAKGQRHRAGRDAAGGALRQTPPERRVEEESDERQQRNQQQHGYCSGGFGPATPQTRSLAGTPRSPLRSRELTRVRSFA